MTEPKKRTTRKKVVKAHSTPEARAEDATTTWKPSPEANAKATKFRIIAAILWVIAIGLEGGAIYWLLQDRESFETTDLLILIGAFVVIGAFALTGSLLWKKANQAGPARKADTVRFFVQNQLGAIIAVIAFLPLIVMVLLNKDMSGKQKGIAGGIGAAIFALVFALSIETDSPSVEQYTAEANVVQRITGSDQVYWTKYGKVFHLCKAAGDVNRESSDNTITQGTVGDAHAAGKERLTKKIGQEAKECGFEIPADLLPAGSDPDDATLPDGDLDEGELLDAPSVAVTESADPAEPSAAESATPSVEESALVTP